MQFSLFGLLLLTQPLHSSEQHTRANLEFSSNFAGDVTLKKIAEVGTSIIFRNRERDKFLCASIEA